MSEINLTNKNFEEEVFKSEKPVPVDFFAILCGPCQMLAPIITEIAEENGDKIKVAKVNVDEQQELAMKYDVSSIPTLIVFKNGNIANKVVGFHSKEEIINILMS